MRGTDRERQNFALRPPFWLLNVFFDLLREMSALSHLAEGRDDVAAVELGCPPYERAYGSCEVPPVSVPLLPWTLCDAVMCPLRHR